MADWPHQQRGVQDVLARQAAGVPSVCLSSPTGGGKSRIIQRLCEAWVRQNLRSCVLTNRKLLTSQLSKSLHAGGVNVGVVASEFESWTNLNAPVQVCSIQTLLARVLEQRKTAIDAGMDPRLAKRNWPLPACDRLVLDEVHISKAGVVQELISEWRELYNMQLVGVTATPLGVSHICQELIIAGNNSELRGCGALVPARLHMPKIFDMPKIRRSKTGLFTQEELNSQAKAIWSQHVVGHIYGSWKDLNPHALPALGMAPGRKESLGLAMEFHSHGVNAAHICSESIYVDGKLYQTTAQEDRDELFERSRTGEVPVIWNRFVMREGVDLPWLEHLMLATPIASLLSFIQVCGRVLRASPSTGKKYATISDHAGCIDIHGSPNADRDQDWQDYFYDKPDQITKDRIEKLTDPENTTPEFIVCPKCGMLRATGQQCPNCKFEHQQSVRLVIQENGKLRPVRGDYFRKRKIEVRSDTEKLWSQVYWQFKNAKKPLTFRQALAYFRKKHGYEPPKDLPGMPKDPLDLVRPVKFVSRDRLLKKEEPVVEVPRPKKKTLFSEEDL